MTTYYKIPSFEFVIEARDNGWLARLAEDHGVWEYGTTFADAVGKLALSVEAREEKAAAPSRDREYSMERYTHHHGRWVETRSVRHLYALRAHLKQLGWLAAEYDRPGYGLR